jgi:mevalonate kinase
MKTEDKTQSVKVKCPGKLMILGEHAVVYGTACIVSSIDKYLYITLKINSSNVDIFETGDVKDNNFLINSIQIFRRKYQVKDKFIVSTNSELGNYGLGSSSAVVVAFFKAVSKLYDLNLKDKEIFKLSFNAVRLSQGISSGFDIASAIYGYTLLFDGKTKKHQVICRKPLPILVIYTGKKGNTRLMIERVSENFKKNPDKLNNMFTKINELVIKANIIIKEHEWERLADIMEENQKILDGIGISDDKVDRFLDFIKKNGMKSVKISGAGGGDCLLVLKKHLPPDFYKKIQNMGGEIIKCSLGVTKGVEEI